MMIGDKIRLTRENKGLSREHIAAVLNLDVRTYEKIEHNKRDLQLSEVEKISEVLDISPQELLFGEPRLVFEHCNQNAAVYNSGTINHSQNTEEIKKVYDTLIETLKETIRDKERIIEMLSKK